VYLRQHLDRVRVAVLHGPLAASTQLELAASAQVLARLMSTV
jgi:hypothetical protein